MHTHRGDRITKCFKRHASITRSELHLLFIESSISTVTLAISDFWEAFSLFTSYFHVISVPVSSGCPNVLVQAGDVGRPHFATTADNSRACLDVILVNRLHDVWSTYQCIR